MDLLSITTNDEFVYLPHATLLLSREKPNFDILIPVLQVYFNYMVLPGLCGITASSHTISEIYSKVEKFLEEKPVNLNVPKDRYELFMQRD